MQQKTFRFFLLIAFGLIITLPACTTDKRREVVTYYPDSDRIYEQYTIRLPDSLRQGAFRSFYESGEMKEESFYQNGVLHGTRTLFYETGTPMIRETHEEGRFHGLYQSFYENGKVDLEGNYVDGSMEGEWRRYYDSGELMEIVSFHENLENGPFTEFYKNGNLKAEGQYLNGDAEHGLLKLYNEEGELIRKMDCKNGICRTIWKKEGIE